MMAPGHRRLPFILLCVSLITACLSTSPSTSTADVVTVTQPAPTTTPVASSAPPTTPVESSAPPTATATPTNTLPTTSTTAVPAQPCGWAPPPDRYEHVIWIWMENKNADVLQASRAPFLAGLAAACGSSTDYRDAGLHPSLPGYISATSGDAQGIGDDDGPAAHPLTVDNLFRQVRSTGQTARSYAEGMDAPCQLRSHDRYAVKHVPALYYTGGDDRSACATDVLPFSAFARDLHDDTLPAFASLTPDLCHDMHDCPVSTGDGWLSLVLPSIITSASYARGRTAVFVIWDESAGAGTMPFVAIAPDVAPGTVVTTPSAMRRSSRSPRTRSASRPISGPPRVRHPSQQPSDCDHLRTRPAPRWRTADRPPTSSSRDGIRS